MNRSNRQLFHEMREAAATFVLLASFQDEAVCACGEPWELGRAALDDLAGSDLLAFQFNAAEDMVSCPACQPIKNDRADRIWRAYRILNEVPADDDPEALLDLVSGKEAT